MAAASLHCPLTPVRPPDSHTAILPAHSPVPFVSKAKDWEPRGELVPFLEGPIFARL